MKNESATKGQRALHYQCPEYSIGSSMQSKDEDFFCIIHLTLNKNMIRLMENFTFVVRHF
jgi:hypothetical protein